MENKDYEESESPDGTFDPDFVDPYSAQGGEDADVSLVFCAKCAREFPSYQAKMDGGGAICPECASEVLAAARQEEEKEQAATLPEEPAAAKKPEAPAEPAAQVYQAEIKRYSYEEFKKTSKPNGHAKRGFSISGAFSGIMEAAAKAILGGNIGETPGTLEGLLDNSAQYPLSLFSGELGREYSKMDFTSRQRLAYGYAFLKKVDDNRFTLGDIVSRLGTADKIRALKTIYFAAPTQKAGEREFPALSFDRAYDIVEKIYRGSKEQ
ncbi:MAG: hypothetical protein WC506_03115 [Candidatus Micrarchaeia archaeon]